MKFRKNARSFYERNMMCAVMIVLALLVLPSNFGLGITVGAVLLLGIALILGICADNEFITMSESGIGCVKGKNILWEFAWEDITELKRSCRNRRACVEIVLKDGVLQPLSGISVHSLYFELGSVGKKALEAYEPCKRKCQ